MGTGCRRATTNLAVLQARRRSCIHLWDTLRVRPPKFTSEQSVAQSRSAIPKSKQASEANTPDERDRSEKRQKQNQRTSERAKMEKGRDKNWHAASPYDGHNISLPLFFLFRFLSLFLFIYLFAARQITSSAPVSLPITAHPHRSCPFTVCAR